MTAQPVPSTSPVELMAAQTISDTTGKNRRKTLAQFQRFASANGLPTMPTTEDAVLVWLEAHADRWAHSTMSGYVDNLAGAYVAAGQPDPTRGAVRAYLRQHARRVGKAPRLKIAAVAGRDIAAAVGNRQAEERPSTMLVPRNRAVIWMRRLTALPWNALAGLRSNTVRVTGDQLIITLPYKTVRAQRWDDPGMCPVTALDHYLSTLSKNSPMLFGQTWVAPAPGRKRIATIRPVTTARLTAPIRGAARRAGIPADLSCWPELLDEADLRWLLACTDPTLLRKTRDWTYLAVLYTSACRHADVADLTWADVTSTTNDTTMHLGRTKPDQEARRTERRQIPHVAGQDQACADWCPACLLTTWRQFTTRAWGRDNNRRIFPAMRAGQHPSGRWNVWDAGRAVRGILGDEYNGHRVATRTARSSMATDLFADGVPLSDIQRVTGHESVTQLTRYIRLHDPYTGQYHLPV